MFRAVVSTPLVFGEPVKLADLTNAIASGSFTTAMPGGYANCSLTLRPGWREPVPDGAHLEVFPPAGEAARGVCWEGQRRVPEFAGRDLVSLQASGYSLTLSDADQLSTAYLKSTTEAQLSAGAVLQYAMATIAPLLSVGAPWGDPGVQHPLSSFDNRTLWDVAQQLGTESGWGWQVWAGRQATFAPRVVGPTPDYLIPVEDCPQWELDDSALWTRVAVAYTDAATGLPAQTDDAINLQAEALRGAKRRTVIQGGTLDRAGAIAQAQTTLRNSATPTLRATIGPVTRLRTYSGSSVPGYAVQAGQWVQVGGYGESRGVTEIVQTSVDWLTGAVTLQLGAPLLDVFGRLSNLATSVALVRAGTNLATLARA